MPHSCRHRIAYKSLEKVAAIKLHDKLFSLCWKLWCRFLSCCERATHKHRHTHIQRHSMAVVRRVLGSVDDAELFSMLSFFCSCILWCVFHSFFFSRWHFFCYLESSLLTMFFEECVTVGLCVSACAATGDLRATVTHLSNCLLTFDSLIFCTIMCEWRWENWRATLKGKKWYRIVWNYVSIDTTPIVERERERGRNDEWTTHFLLCLSCPFDDDNKCWHYDYDYCRRVWPNGERDGKSSFDGTLSIDCNDIGFWFYVTAINFAICSYRGIRCLFLLSGLPKKGSTKQHCTLHLFAQRLHEWRKEWIRLLCTVHRIQFDCNRQS